jgi:hypothetical protein
MCWSEDGLSERLSAKFSALREEMRLVSAITALNLIQEKRYTEAEPYRASFLEIKDCPVKILAKELGSPFLPNGNEPEQLATKMLEVASVLSKQPELIDNNEAEACSSVLMELLDAVTSGSG